MRKLALLFVCIFSLALCVTIAAIWIRSSTVADQLIIGRPAPVGRRYARADWSVISECGELVFTKEHLVPPDDASAAWLQARGYGWDYGPVDGYTFELSTLLSGATHLRMYTGSKTRQRYTAYWRSIEIPDWLLLLVVSLPVQVVLIRRYLRRRHGSECQ